MEDNIMNMTKTNKTGIDQMKSIQDEINQLENTEQVMRLRLLQKKVKAFKSVMRGLVGQYINATDNDLIIDPHSEWSIDDKKIIQTTLIDDTALMLVGSRYKTIFNVRHSPKRKEVDPTFTMLLNLNNFTTI